MVLIDDRAPDGRTSSEVLRSESEGGAFDAVEYAVMDRAGRVQVPQEFREALDLTRRVRLALAGDHVQIRSDSASSTEPADGAS